MSDVKNRISALLASLGDTADEVAESLRARKIRGGCDGGSCPIANLIRAEIPEAGEADWYDVPECGSWWWVQTTFVEAPHCGVIGIPTPVVDFIRAHDRHRAYPDLYPPSEDA